MYHSGGKFGPGGQGGHHSHMGGAHHHHGPGAQGGTPIAPNYVCDRCKTSGHRIEDCPTNGDHKYDPSQRKGIPTSILWKDVVAPKIFRQKRSAH